MTQSNKLPTVLSVLIGILFALQTAQAQERNNFRRDCNYFREYNERTEEWSDWKEGSSTFAFNINTNNDIKVIYPSGVIEVMRNLGDKEEGKTTDNVAYQSLKIMDEGGLIGRILLYEDGSVMLYFQGFVFQYSP